MICFLNRLCVDCQEANCEETGRGSESLPRADLLQGRGATDTPGEYSWTGWESFHYTIIIPDIMYNVCLETGLILHEGNKGNCLCVPWSLHWCPWNAPVEIYNFLIGCALYQGEKCLLMVPLPFQQQSIQAWNVASFYDLKVQRHVSYRVCLTGVRVITNEKVWNLDTNSKVCWNDAISTVW